MKTNNVETKKTQTAKSREIEREREREKKKRNNGMKNNNGGKGETNQECGEAQRWGKIEKETDGDLEEKVSLISDGTVTQRNWVWACERLVKHRGCGKHRDGWKG